MVSKPVFGLLMFLLGAFVLFAFRFATYKSPDVHYHANFALYVNGQLDDFKSFAHYEEIATCNVHDEDNVKGRVHMHSQKPGLLHVHAVGVTWGEFFANLGYTLGNKVLVTDAGTYVDGQDGKSLNFMLNDKPVEVIQNQVIKSTDRLLINYGSENAAALATRYATVPSDADTANKTNDPSACSGADESTLMQRLKAAMGLQSH